MSEASHRVGGALRRYGIPTGVAAGVAAAGTAVGVVLERRGARRRTFTADGMGELRSEPRSVRTEDGLHLHVEIDEAGGRAGADAPTLVFVHGFALNLDSWHFQRAALRGSYRMVFYDQRSHGRSDRSDREHSTIDQLGRDLAAVLEQMVGVDPVILVGHSMGVMTILALAEQHPDWFGTRVRGVGLVSASAGALRVGSLGVPGVVGRLMDKAAPGVVTGLARLPRAVEFSRRVGSDVVLAMTKAFGFGPEAPRACVEFTAAMLAQTPIDVLAAYFTGFSSYDKSEALPVLAKVPVVVVSGGLDPITPAEHARRIVDGVSSAELVEVPDAGHMVLLEAHEQVSGALEQMIKEARTG